MLLRSATRVFVFAFAATLVLTGCQRSSDAPPSEAAAPLPENVRRWVLVEGDEGAALSLLGEGERQVFHIACLADPSRLQVIVSEVTPIGSEDRLTLGAGGDAFAMAADLEHTGPGVLAEGPIDPAFLEDLSRSEEISAMYGSQQVGPYPAPTSDDRSAFVLQCRALASTPGAATEGQLPETDDAP